LTHVGVHAEYEDRTEAGWTGILDGLAWALGEGSESVVEVNTKKKSESR